MTETKFNLNRKRRLQLRSDADLMAIVKSGSLSAAAAAHELSRRAREREEKKKPSDVDKAWAVHNAATIGKRKDKKPFKLLEKVKQVFRRKPKTVAV